MPSPSPERRLSVLVPEHELRPRDEGYGRFVGSAICRYDVDELDDLGKVQKREKFVEVKRPDGTIAKARGERTFYGAFTGGFSAGYWGTVGSKEGWTPAAFSSSRSKRDGQRSLQVEDFMDEEDLREHRASHRTMATKGDFAEAAGVGAKLERRNVAVPAGGLPRELEEDVFGPRTRGLGARLLEAGTQSLASASETTAKGSASKNSDVRDLQSEDSQTKPRKRYGCERPPSDLQDAPSRPVDGDGDLVVCRPRPQALRNKTSSNRARASRHLEADLERLWQSKTDLHGIGYGTTSFGGSSSSKHVPSAQRLFMSSKRGKAQGSGSAYSDFGTGVFDMDDYDTWENVYDSDEKPAHYECALKDEDVEEEMRLARLDEVRVSERSRAVAEGELSGFSEASKEDELVVDLTRWEPPPVPRGYRGMHVSHGSAQEEARNGSAEHVRLMEFLGKYGKERLMDPSHRAELLGEKSRGLARPPQQPSQETTAPISVEEQGDAVVDLTADPVKQDLTADPVQRDTSAPLWQGMSDAAKQTLLKNLGRNFVYGQDQDMDGRSGKHEPFKSDPKKQARYTQFCLALEGKASAAEALKDDLERSAEERDAELAEFGRVYRLFRQDHPEVDMASALDVKTSVAPALRRIVLNWTPDKLLCKRWGVPEPAPKQVAELRSAKRQRDYTDQVNAGLAKLKEGFSEAPATVAATITPTAATSATTHISAEPPRPPESLFTAIFGDDDSDNDVVLS